MDRKKLVLLIGALVIAIGTALMARSLFAGAAAPEAQAAVQPQGPRVLVAQRTLPVGTIVTADALNFQLWPADMVQDAYYLDGETDVSKLIGTVVRFPVTAGQPVTQGALVSPGDRGFLAAALGPGMRAVTVQVNDQTGVSGFVFPGDRIDLVLTQEVSGDGQDLKASETILRNLRVLATDKMRDAATEEGQTVVTGFTYVTLEVTPKIAEKIAVAKEIGTLSISLRSIADNAGELERAIASGEVVIPDGASADEEKRIIQAAMASPQDGETTFVTGGDVSRFQRRTVPAQRGNGDGPRIEGPDGPPRPRGPAFMGQGPIGPGEPKIVGPTVTVRRADKVTVEEAGK